MKLTSVRGFTVFSVLTVMTTTGCPYVVDASDKAGSYQGSLSLEYDDTTGPQTIIFPDPRWFELKAVPGIYPYPQNATLEIWGCTVPTAVDEQGALGVLDKGLRLCKILIEGRPPLLLDFGGLQGSIDGGTLSLSGQGDGFVAVQGGEQLDGTAVPLPGTAVSLRTASYRLTFVGEKR